MTPGRCVKQFPEHWFRAVKLSCDDVKVAIRQRQIAKIQTHTHAHTNKSNNSKDAAHAPDEDGWMNSNFFSTAIDWEDVDDVIY